jgi:acyl-CoA synthetase (AMP-forming)/AMP-acid ligase II
VNELSRLNARRFPNKVAIVCNGRSMTFGQVDELANRVANALLAGGVQHGDRVAFLAFNCLEYIPLMFGIVKTGAMCVPLNFRLTADELAHMLTDSGAETLFFGPEFQDMADVLRARLPRMSKFIGIGHDAGCASSLDSLTRGNVAREPAVAIDEDDGLFVMYTSGTTGRPKGAVQTHRALVEQISQIALVTRVTHHDVALVTIPLFHGGGMCTVALPHLYMGARVVVMPRFDAGASLELIEREGITTFSGVPSQYTMLLDVPNIPRFDTRSLRSAVYGGAPMPIEVLTRALELWPQVKFFQTYGQTETQLVTILDPEEHVTHFGATGREFPGVEMRVVDERGIDVPAGAIGEIIVRRETGMKEYFGNPEQTAETIHDGWIYTGDLARIDEDRYITIVDRKRDVILSGGENIYPKEIEEVLCIHPAVLEAAVVGAADPKWGEVPWAYIVLRSDADADSNHHLEEWCAARLGRYKLPKRWEFVEELPKTANGKIRKTVVRDWARGRLPRGAGPDTSSH